MAKKLTRREGVGVKAAKRLDEELIKQLEADRYDPRAFPRVLTELVNWTDDPWEQQECRRRCAGRQLLLAVHHHRGLGELSRLFGKQKKLGYSSMDDEFSHLSVYCHALARRGQRALARAMLRDFADRIEELRKEAGFMRKAVARTIDRL
jgi:hypothetical protein